MIDETDGTDTTYGAGRGLVVRQWSGAEAKQLRVALRLTIESFAESLGISSRAVDKWEARGETLTPLPDTQAMLDTTLARADPGARERFMRGLAHSNVAHRSGLLELPGAGAPVRGAADIDGAEAWTPEETSGLIGRVTRADLALDRREVTQAVAGVVVGVAVLERLERWLPGPDRPPVRRRSGVGSIEVAQIEQVARVFRSADDQFGGGLRRKAVVGQLSEVADELRDFSHPPALTQRLFAVMAQLAETVATMSWDSGQGAIAQRYYVLALRATKEAGDRAFGANVLAGMARQQYYLGHVTAGLELVRMAHDGLDGHGTAAVRAMLRTREAWGYALQGRLAAFSRATSRAEDSLAEAGRPSEPYWIEYFDEAELAGVTGGRLLEVAHHQPTYAAQAAALIARAVELRRPRSLRSAALDQIGLAETRLVQDEPEEAARLGHSAVEVAQDTHSDRVRVKLAEFHQHTNPYRTIKPIAELRERLDDLSAAS
ncbi:MAG: hypothetical protein ACRCYU_01245 [Nocardioides sp.]